MAAKLKKGDLEAAQLEAAQAKREMEATRDLLEANILQNAIGRPIAEIMGLLASLRNGGEGDQGLRAAAALVRHLLPAFNAAARDPTIQASPNGFALVKQWRDALLAVDASADATAVADALAAPVKAKIRTTNSANAKRAARDRGDLAARVAEWQANPELYVSKAHFIREALGDLHLSKRRLEEILKADFGI